MRSELVFSIVCAVLTVHAASARPPKHIDAGTVDVSAPGIQKPKAFIVLSRIVRPDIAPAVLPEAARAPYAELVAAETAAREHGRKMHADAEASGEAPDDWAREGQRKLEWAADTVAARIATLLDASAISLTDGARVLLADCRWRVGFGAYSLLLDEFSRCSEKGGECVEPRFDPAPVLDVLAKSPRPTDDPALHAYGRYVLGLTLTDVGRSAEAETAFRAAVAEPDSDARVRAASAYHLGDLLAERHDARALESFATAMRLGDPQLVFAALHRRAAVRFDTLDWRGGLSEVVSTVRDRGLDPAQFAEIGSETLMALGPAGVALLDGFPEPQRSDWLVRAAEGLAIEGHRRWAGALVAALGPQLPADSAMPRRVVQVLVEPEASPERPADWVRRVVERCFRLASGTGPVSGTFRIVLTPGMVGAKARVTKATGTLHGVQRCLGRPVPPPESDLMGQVHASVRILAH